MIGTKAKPLVKGLSLLGVTLSLLLAGTAFAETLRIRAVLFEGSLPFTKEKALELVAVPIAKPLDSKNVDEAAVRLRDACRRRDYPLARVGWRATSVAEGRHDLIFQVDPGRQGRLLEVRLVGNKAIAERDLKQQLRLKPRQGFVVRWLGLGAWSEEVLAKDRASLLAYYQHRGYAAVEIDESVLEWIPALDGFRLTWPIRHEGPVYSVGAIRLDLEEQPQAADLKRIIGIQTGERFERQRVKEAVQRFEVYYQERGYAFPKVEGREEWDDAHAQINLLFKAEIGVKPVLRDIIIRGNTNTSNRIVLREISLKSGDRFNAEEIQETLARLSALPLFSKVSVHYLGGRDQPAFDLVVDVVERKTGRVEIGVVYGESEGMAFQFKIMENNLALTPPFRGQALQGSLGLTWGSETIRSDVGLRNPRLYDGQWSMDTRGFYEDSEAISDYYDQRTYGGNLLFSHPVGRHHMFSTGYAVTGYEVYNLEPFTDSTPSLLLESDQKLFVTAWVFGWNADYTDRVIRPTRGVRLRGNLSLGNQALGGDADLVQTEFGASLFVSPVFRHVLSLRAGVKSVDPYGDTETVALPLRTFLGGSRDLRGFDYNSVSPFDAEGRPIGGQSAWWSTAEYRIPLIRWLDLAVYYDMGDVGLDAYDFSGDGPVSNWGIGILIQAEEFPVRFDFATPIKTLEGDRRNEKGDPHFSFSAGYRF